MQAQAMVETDSTRPWRDFLEGRLICPAALFHTTSHEHTILDMIQEFPLMAAGHHLHASIFWCGVVQHHHHCQKVRIDVGEEGEILMYLEGTHPLGWRLRGNLGVFKVNVIAKQRPDSAKNLFAFSQV